MNEARNSFQMFGPRSIWYVVRHCLPDSCVEMPLAWIEEAALVWKNRTQLKEQSNEGCR